MFYMVNYFLYQKRDVVNSLSPSLPFLPLSFSHKLGFYEKKIYWGLWERVLQVPKVNFNKKNSIRFQSYLLGVSIAEITIHCIHSASFHSSSEYSKYQSYIDNCVTIAICFKQFDFTCTRVWSRKFSNVGIYYKSFLLL